MSIESLREEAVFTAFMKQLRLLYYAILASMVAIYAVVIIILAPESGKVITENVTTFLIAIPVINAVIVGTASVLFRLKVKAALNAESTEQRIAEYRVGWLIRSALLESLAILDAFAYFTMHDMKFEILYILVLLLYVISAYPNPEKVKREMGL